jgi:hypothetical protein
MPTGSGFFGGIWLWIIILFFLFKGFGKNDDVAATGAFGSDESLLFFFLLLVIIYQGCICGETA